MEIAESNEDIRELLLESLKARGGGVSRSSTAAGRGILKKQASDQSFFEQPEAEFWAQRARIKHKLKVRPGKSW